jgi:NDP-sugar pyrophosphorylase family protein
LTQLAAEGIDEAVINLHHLPDSLRETLGDGSSLGLSSLRYSLEPRELLGTGGGVVHASSFLRGDGPILVRNSDFLADIPIDELVAFHERAGRAATLVLAPHRPATHGCERTTAVGWSRSEETPAGSSSSPVARSSRNR